MARYTNTKPLGPNRLPSWERVKEVFHYDPDTGIFTYKAGYWEKRTGTRAGSVNPTGHPAVPRRAIAIDRRAISAARLAWFYMTGEWPEHEIDHKRSEE